MPDNPQPLLEDSPLRGLFTDFYYSQHKHANEIWLDGLQLAFPRSSSRACAPALSSDPHQYSAASLAAQNRTYYTTPRDAQVPVQLIHEDDLAAAFHSMVQYDLPGAYNVVGEGAEPMPGLAAQADLQVVELPEEALLQAATAAWQSGASIFGPKWVTVTHPIICSGNKLKSTGSWTPRYSTASAYAATVAALT